MKYLLFWWFCNNLLSKTGQNKFVYNFVLKLVNSVFPQGLENRENREKNNGQPLADREKSGKSQGIVFWAKSQGILL